MQNTNLTMFHTVPLIYRQHSHCREGHNQITTLATTSATLQLPSRHTSFKMLRHLVCELLHSQGFQKIGPPTLSSRLLRFKISKIFNRCTYCINLKVLHRLFSGYCIHERRCPRHLLTQSGAFHRLKTTCC